MQQNIESTFNLFDDMSIRLFNYLYTISVASEAVKDNGSNSGGIVIIGMIVVIIGIIGFIMSSNNK